MPSIEMGTVRWEALWRRPGRVAAALPVLGAAAGGATGGSPWMTEAVSRAAQRLGRALEEESPAGARAGAAALGGLGPGSTPAGDDVLVGVCHGLWTAGGPWPGQAAVLAAVAAPRTTGPSAAWLEAAAGGRASAPWRRLLSAIATAGPEETDRAATGVAALGGSSGAWSLYGFCLATAALGGGCPEVPLLAPRAETAPTISLQSPTESPP